MSKSLNIRNFRDTWLEDFFERATPHRKIPADIHTALARKLDIINAAVSHRDLRSPPGNRYEELTGKLQEYSSIRVNKQYRLIFKWVNQSVSLINPDSELENILDFPLPEIPLINKQQSIFSLETSIPK